MKTPTSQAFYAYNDLQSNSSAFVYLLPKLLWVCRKMAESKERIIMIAMDGSSFCDYAFDCKYIEIENFSCIFPKWFMMITAPARYSKI